MTQRLANGHTTSLNLDFALPESACSLSKHSRSNELSLVKKNVNLIKSLNEIRF